MAAEDLMFSATAPLSSEATSEHRTMRQLWWRLCLKPYGDDLCTPGASFWIFSARIAIFIMAAAEAISWSYLGYYIGESSQPYVTAAIAGLAVFSVIWIIDASFITLDTSRAKDESTLLGHPSGGGAEKIKLAAGLIIRSAIICATLFISAPFLAQLVFFRDISAEMNRRDATLIAERREELARSLDARVTGLLQLRAQLDSASIQEAAGAGASRRMGRGPAVATIERRLDDVNRDIAAARADKSQALTAFDALPRSALQKRYGLRFSENGIRARAEILERLTQNSTYANAELAIRGFLAFLFLALLVLKLFQPASVSVYFSETLQDLNAQYRSGAFDSWLAQEERPNGRAAMTPLRFREWCRNSLRSIRSEDEQQRRINRISATRAVREVELGALRRNAETEFASARNAFDEAKDEMSVLQHALQKVSAETEASRADLIRTEGSLDSVNATLRSGISGDPFLRAADARASLESELSQARAALRAREADADRCRRQLEAQQQRVAELRARMAGREAVLELVEKQLMQLTTDTTAAVAL